MEVILQILAHAGEIPRRTSIPRRLSSPFGPIPESISNCGDRKVPAETMTSQAALARSTAPKWRYSIPATRAPVKISLVTWAWVWMVGFGRDRAG
jgi:hypothetical protein